MLMTFSMVLATVPPEEGEELANLALPLTLAVTVLVLAMLQTWILQFQVTAEVISVTVPFVSPKGSYVTQPDRYHTFRIPGIETAPDGSLIAAAA